MTIPSTYKRNTVGGSFTEQKIGGVVIGVTSAPVLLVVLLLMISQLSFLLVIKPITRSTTVLVQHWS